MQIKPTITNHFTRVRMAIIKKFTNKKCWQGCGEKGTLLHCCWKCKLVATMENSMLVYLLSRVQLLQVRGLQPARLLCPWDFPGKNTGVGCHFLLQGIFPTQRSNTGLLHCRRILYQLSHQGSLWRFLRKLKIELPCNPAIPFLDIYLEKTLIQKDTYPSMYVAMLFTIAKTWKQPKCPSMDEWIKKMWYIHTMEY